MEKIYVPRIDPALETAKIMWEKKEGEPVEKNEVLLIAEGEKTSFEVESPIKGVLHKILYPSESDVPVGEVIGIVREPGEKIEDDFEIKEKITEKVEKKPSDIVSTIDERKILKEIHLEGTRKTTAKRLSYSHKTFPPATLMVNVNMEKIINLRRNLNEKLNKKLAFTAFLAKATAVTLKNHRILNASLEEDRIKVYKEVNLSIAINTPNGLVTPAVFNTDQKSIEAISNEIIKLTEKAKKNKLELSELVNGTFTLTNLGGFGIETFIPLINPPQAAILGVGKTCMKPVIKGDTITIKPVATFTLVFDHRIIDGVPAANFLTELKKNLENPELE